MEDTRRLRDILLDQCEAKELRVEELAKKTGIPESYLDAIINDVRTRLPAFPYIRQHLIKVATVLGLPPDLLLSKYRQEFLEKISGGGDALPGNRFALASGMRRYLIIAGAIAAFLILYSIGRSGFLGQPHITIDMPPVGQDPYITTSSTVLLAGHADAGDTLLINGQPVPVDQTGAFSREYPLLPEINIIEFSAKRFLGREITITRQVYYEEPTSTPAAAKASKKIVVPAPSSKEAATTTDSIPQ